MRLKFLIIPIALTFQAVYGQDSIASSTLSQVTVTVPVSPATIAPPVSRAPSASPTSTQTSILDYKSVYEASSVEEEVQMAAERFNLTPSQQDVWLSAATDRRATEKQARLKLDSSAGHVEKDGIYRGIRSSHNTFHETITGYLTPAQKQAVEDDRIILEEKRKRVAKLPPPPPPAPVVTVMPVDSAAIKAAEKDKAAAKKSKKKKKPVTTNKPVTP